jgi:RNA polymerase sigma-70 factor (ECF subfamily)
MEFKKSLSYPDLIGLSDEALMSHLKVGHHDALAVLFDRYHHLVLAVAVRILKDRTEAEDLMQAVFLEIFRCAAQYDEVKGSTKMWILQYAYHRSFNRRKHLARRGVHELSLESIQAEQTPSMHQPIYRGHLESAQAVREALGRLKKAQRKTLELAFYEGFTMSEIAEITGTTFDSVRHHYYRGLERVRSILCGVRGGQPDTSSAQESGAHVQPRTL